MGDQNKFCEHGNAEAYCLLCNPECLFGKKHFFGEDDNCHECGVDRYPVNGTGEQNAK